MPNAKPTLPNPPAYPGTARDFDGRTKALREQLESIRLLIEDSRSNAQDRDRLLARHRQLYEYLELEFGHGPLPVTQTDLMAWSSYTTYLDARADVAKEALKTSDVPRRVRAEMERQATAPHPEQPAGDTVPADDADERAFHALRVTDPAWSPIMDLKGPISDVHYDLALARQAIAERWKDGAVSDELARRVRKAARTEFATPALKQASTDPLAVRFYNRYRWTRHEFARAVGMAGLTPPEVAKSLQEAAHETVAAPNDAEAQLTDRIRRQAALSRESNARDDDRPPDLDLGSPEGQEEHEFNLRAGQLEFMVNWVRDISAQNDPMPSFIDDAKKDAIDEFSKPPRSRTSGHPVVWRAEKFYRWERHAFALALVKAGWVPPEVKKAVDDEVRENVERVEHQR
jgi:hypothetical protein